MKGFERRMVATILFSARASIDAALLAIGERVDEEEDEGCAHPKDEREDLTEMGGPLEWRCRVCGFHSITPDQEG